MPLINDGEDGYKGLSALQQRLHDPLLSTLTVMLAVLLFVLAPLQAANNLTAHYFGIAFGFVLVATAFIVSRNVIAMLAILFAIALIIISTVIQFKHPSIIDIYFDATAWLIAGVAMGVVAVGAVFAPGEITYHRIIGAVLLYLVIGLIFVALFCFVALAEPHAFSGPSILQNDMAVASNLVYFSFVSLTSVGYGDIVPLHPYARSLANIEAIIGQLYPATLLARLVTLELENRHHQK